MDRDKAAQLLTARVLASIVESSDDAIIGKSLDGTIQSWNAAAERLFGYPADQAMGRHISLVIPAERIAEEDHIITSLKAGKRIEHFETERVRSDGRRILVSLTISPIKDDAGNVIGASKIVRDITDRKRAEADREKFVTLIENSTDFIGMCDLEGVPFFVNRAGLEMVGLDDLEAPAACPLHRSSSRKISRGSWRSSFRRSWSRATARSRCASGISRPAPRAGWPTRCWCCRTPPGQPIAFATVSQDVTERKRLEDDLRRLAADLSEADRRKNEFLAMLAHELRNPLAPISNAARALRLGGRDGDALRPASDMLERQVGQMARLVDDLLDMSRITRGKDRAAQGPRRTGAHRSTRPSKPSARCTGAWTMS